MLEALFPNPETIGKTCALLAAVLWAVSVMLFQGPSKGVSPIAATIIRNVVVFASVAIVIGLQGDLPNVGSFNSRTILGIVLSALIGVGFADTMFFMAVRRLEVGIVGLLQTLYSPLILVLSAVFLGESLTGLQMVGGACILTGILLVKVSYFSTRKSGAGDLFGFIAMIGCVIGNCSAIVILKVSMASVPILVLVSSRALLGIVPLFLFILVQNQSAHYKDILKKANWIRLFPGSMLGGLGATSLWLLGFRYTSASIAALLNESSSFFMVLLGWLILKEQLTKTKIAAFVLALIGLPLLWL